MKAAVGTGIGQPVRRKEDFRLLTGGGRFTTDVDVRGQLYAVFVRSPHAHARILSINAADTMATPGVVAAFSAADLIADNVRPIAAVPGFALSAFDVPIYNRDGSPLRTFPQPLFPIDKARYVGEPLAVVVGRTLQAANDGAERMHFEYEVLMPVTNTYDAAQPGAPIVWDGFPNNVCVDAEFGDLDATNAAFKRAKCKVGLKTWVQRVSGTPMEARSAVCEYDATRDHFTLYCSGDSTVRSKRILASLLNISEDKVRVIAKDIGGNFGTRNWFYTEYGVVAWAARRLNAPVKWTNTRSEGMISDYQGRDLHADAELALDEDGNFIGLRASLIGNVGAHPLTFSPLNKTCETLTSVYNFEAAFILGRAVTSNTTPTAPYRSSGRAESMFVIERLIGLAAREYGFDPIELRRRNLIPSTTMPKRTAVGLAIDNGDYQQALDKAVELGAWQDFPARRAEARARGKLRGVGIANYIEVTAGAPRERCDITVHPDGIVDVVLGTTPSGQGHETVFSQCVSEWLGVPFDKVQLIYGDTDIVKEGGGSHAARSMRLGGIVVNEASRKVISKARLIAAHILHAQPENIDFAKGVFRCPDKQRNLDLFEVAHIAQTSNSLPAELAGTLGGSYDFINSNSAFPYGSQFGEIEIDPDTGSVEVVNIVAVDDVGRAINPLILHGQGHGGIVTGLGQALWEHACYDRESGQMLAGSFMDYALPRADYVPFFTTEIMEVPSPTNALGVRGGGEGGTTPALAVIGDAIFDALSEFGVRHMELPFTTERIWRAIQSAKDRIDSEK